jgi:hypothetical protein
MHQVKEETTTKKRKFHIDNSNGLCDHCNYYQQVKIEKLAEFKPNNEVSSNSFMNIYKIYLRPHLVRVLIWFIVISVKKLSFSF